MHLKFTLKLNELFFLTLNFSIFVFLVSISTSFIHWIFLSKREGRVYLNKFEFFPLLRPVLFSGERNSTAKVLASRSCFVGLWVGSNFLRAVHIENHTFLEKATYSVYPQCFQHISRIGFMVSEWISSGEGGCRKVQEEPWSVKFPRIQNFEY